MPAPGTKDAPKFDEDYSSELLRFFDRMEDLFAAHDITDDTTKKKSLGKYTSAVTEDQWKALKTFTEGTFAAHKKAIIRSYPDAEALESGSLARLEKIVRASSGNNTIGMRDETELSALILAFRSEALKLQTPPALVSNRELVTMFFSCLTDSFVNRIADKLDQLPKPDKETRYEDRYELGDAIDIAAELARYASQSLRQYRREDRREERRGEREEPARARGRETPRPERRERQSEPDRIPKLEEDLALLKDSVHLQDKKFDQVLSAIQGLQYQGPPPPQRGLPPNLPTSYTRGNVYIGRDANGNLCFYCKETGHRIGDCPHVGKHVSYGWVIRNDTNKIRLPNGDLVPMEGNKSMKEVIEFRNRGRPAVPKAALVQSSFFQDEDYEQEGYYSQAHDQLMHDAEIARQLAALSQGYGREALERVLSRNDPGRTEADDHTDVQSNFP